MTARIYDRLPLEVAQVLRDVATWRAHVLNSRDETAVSALRDLAESADVLARWEGQQERAARVQGVADTQRVVERARRAQAGKPRPKLRIVLLHADEGTDET